MKSYNLIFPGKNKIMRTFGYYFWCFFIYSFFGFLAETVFSFVRSGRTQKRKTMRLLPLCTVYGLGASAMIVCLKSFTFDPVIVFLGGIVVGSVAEYMFAYLFGRFFGVKFWDYAGVKGNFKGRISAVFSAVWGMLSLVLIYFLHPALDGVIRHIPDVFVWPAVSVLIIDTMLTVRMIRRVAETGEASEACPVIKKL